MSPASVRAFQPRHVQLMRALFAAVAAVMITFSGDHSAAIGLSVFSGFAIATGLVLLLSAWLVYPAGLRWPVISLGVPTFLAGMFAGVPAWRTTVVFLVIVIIWAVLTGFLETLAGWRLRAAGDRVAGRDAMTGGIITLLLAVGLLVISPQYALQYEIEGLGSLELTGITIAVGVFGGYTAIIAVYLAIAGFSPQRTERDPAPAVTEDAS